MASAAKHTRAEIRARGPIRFDRSMERAFYGPASRYERGTDRIGWRGGSYTTASAGPAFGSLPAAAFAPPRPRPRRIEIGAPLERFLGKTIRKEPLAPQALEALPGRQVMRLFHPEHFGTRHRIPVQKRKP